MNAFDKIIGYSEIKQELRQIADVLKNPALYRALGASSPRGLLLHGEPGVGKTLMAKCLIDEVGREVFVCRKTDPDGEFVRTIKETFDRAAASEPSVVFLDDMDKFANDDEEHCDSEEYVTVQSCIDEVREKEVFVLATANDIEDLPASLIRAGRFDRVTYVEAPEGADAEEIIRHYLSRKKLDGDLDAKAVACVLEGCSCAALETAINEAALLAGFERAERVSGAHILEACFRTVHKLPSGEHTPIDLSRDTQEARIVCHEAGHAVVSELLSPGSVKLAVVRCVRGKKRGFVKTAPRSAKRHILTSLAGRAAAELRFGAVDEGAASDLDEAFDAARRLTGDLCSDGFELYSHGQRLDSEALKSRLESAVAAKVASCDRSVRELLCANRAFFDATAQALAEKGVLTAADIRAIRESCEITTAAG